MSKTPAEVLIGAREIIADRERWTRERFCETAMGERCAYDSVDARRWSAWAAVCLTSGAVGHAYREALFAFRDYGAANGQGIVTFNDEHSHAEVVEAFDRAIAALSSPGGGA